jgi:methyl-accepting chemotaxis protein
MQNSKAVLEQARAAKEIEKSSLEVTQLAVQIAHAIGEQNKAITELSKEGEEVRRIAKQTSRAIGEQSQVVGMLGSSTLRYTSGMERVVRSMAEQAAGSQQMSQVVTDVRGRTRELSGALASASKVAAPTRDFTALAAELQALRAEYLAHADALTELPARPVAEHVAGSAGAGAVGRV